MTGRAEGVDQNNFHEVFLVDAGETRYHIGTRAAGQRLSFRQIGGGVLGFDWAGEEKFYVSPTYWQTITTVT